MKKLLVALLAFVCVFAGCKNQFGIEEKDDRNMFTLINWRFTSGIANNVIACNAEEGVTFELTADADELRCGSVCGTTITVPANGTAYWSGYGFEDTYISAILRKEGYIAGYGVIKVESLSNAEYRAKVVKSVRFPEGCAVTDVQVNELIAECKTR